MAIKISNRMKKSLLFIITLFLGSILFILVINKVGIDKIVKTILTFKLWHFAVLVGLNGIVSLLSALRWKIILDAMGNFIPFKKVLAARMIGFSVNYLTPSGLILGEPFKAMVLSGKTELSVGSTMVSVIIEGSIYLSTVLLFVIIGVFGFFSYSAVSAKIFSLLVASLIFLLALFYLFYTKMVKPASVADEKGFFTYFIDLLRLHKISFVENLKHKIYRREKEIKTFFRLHKKTVITAIFLSVIELTAMLVGFWLTLYFLGFSINLKALLGLFSLMNISFLIPLPASLGGLEISQIFAFGFFNLGEQVTALSFALITRIVSLFFVAIGIGYLVQFEIDIIYKKSAELAIETKKKIRGFLQSL